MNVIIIVNPLAGNGRALSKWERFKKGINFSYEVMMTKGPKDATAIAKKVSARNTNLLLIAFGGDGTAHEVIEGVVGCKHCTVGVVGAGSGNDFGRGFVSFKSPSQLNHYVSSSNLSKSVDIGLLKSKKKDYYFVNNAGIGFDAVVAFNVNQSSLKKWLNHFGLGKIAYTYYVILTLLTFKRFELTVNNEEMKEHFQNVWFATVSNQPYFGGGMKISPNSNPSDGMIELTVVHDLSRLKLLLVFATVFFGIHTKFKEVQQFTSGSFNLSTNQTVYRHTDGEFAGSTYREEMDEFLVLRDQWEIADFSTS
ncbi:MAG: diacylglycerol kinase family protein [Paenisporosarcina sp.]